jgi:hypothetical protein
MLSQLFRTRGAPPAHQEAPPPLPVDILAGAAQVGLTSGSGHVPAALAFSNPDAGGRVDDIGHHQLIDAYQPMVHRTPNSLFADRPVYGGAAYHAHLDQFRPDPPMTGGHVVVTGRQVVQLGSISFGNYAPEEVVRTPITESSCDVRAAATARPAAGADLADIARAGAAQSLGLMR